MAKVNNRLFEGKCYICDEEILTNHFFYQNICTKCGDFNFQKRNKKSDLSGYTALITGGRIKIGYETALKLLRCGASVITTTRFPNDAALRYSKEKDFSEWKDRLKIFGLDLRHIQAVEIFIKYLLDNIKELNIIINNAAQTVRKPPIFYKHLIQNEINPDASLVNNTKELLLKALENGNQNNIEPDVNLTKMDSLSNTVFSNEYNPALLSQIPLIPGDELGESAFFPVNKFDKDNQQEDRRTSNSWMLKLDEINVIEFMEVLYINLIAPFLFNSKLKELLRKNKKPSFIVNVSAMEGNFYNPEKSEKHVHTNMAKAALNMMTRTSSQDYAQDQIYMNSVDVGWITNERPYSFEMNENERVFKMAIDEIDGAARILDPIFSAIDYEIYEYGNLFKNYSKYPW